MLKYPGRTIIGLSVIQISCYSAIFTPSESLVFKIHRCSLMQVFPFDHIYHHLCACCACGSTISLLPCLTGVPHSAVQVGAHLRGRPAASGGGGGYAGGQKGAELHGLRITGAQRGALKPCCIVCRPWCMRAGPPPSYLSWPAARPRLVSGGAVTRAHLGRAGLYVVFADSSINTRLACVLQAGLISLLRPPSPLPWHP